MPISPDYRNSNYCTYCEEKYPRDMLRCPYHHNILRRNPLSKKWKYLEYKRY